MKKLCSFLAVALLVATAGSALAADFAFHGDLNNRFLVYTNQAGLFTLDKSSSVLDDEGRDDSFGEFKYRLWTEAATNDGNVKGVYAIEVGGVRWGDSSKGGGFSGDGLNVETRWFYTDFQLPFVDGKARVRLGLQPWNVNYYFWNETASAGVLTTDNFVFGLARGKEKITGADEDFGDGDVNSLLARWNYENENLKIGVFGNYIWEDSSEPFSDVSSLTASVKDLIAEYEVTRFGEIDLNLGVLGTDGSWNTPMDFGNLFVNWDLMYQTGSIDKASFDGGATINDLDIDAYLLHGDLGVNIGATRLTYTVLYASGDDDILSSSSDKDFEGWLTVDVDTFHSIILQEGGYTDDFYFTRRPTLGPYGIIMNKLAVDHKASKKLKFGASLIYWLTAEDIEYTDDLGILQKNDEIGIEFDAYVSYMIYPNVELALAAGFLSSGDALDIYDFDSAPLSTPVDGDADNDVFFSGARVRYKF